MTEYIGDIPVSSIQNVTLSKVENTNEIDLANVDSSNIVSINEETAAEIEIDFTLIEGEHPNDYSVEDQKDQVKQISSRQATENYFDYLGIQAFLVVNDVSFNESGGEANIIGGSVSAIALPWPKHFPNRFAGSAGFGRNFGRTFGS